MPLTQVRSKTPKDVFKKTLSNFSTDPQIYLRLSTMSRSGGGVGGVHGGGLLEEPRSA
jgi:hypothetical protein